MSIYWTSMTELYDGEITYVDPADFPLTARTMAEMNRRTRLISKAGAGDWPKETYPRPKVLNVSMCCSTGASPGGCEKAVAAAIHVTKDKSVRLRYGGRTLGCSGHRGAPGS